MWWRFQARKVADESLNAVHPLERNHPLLSDKDGSVWFWGKRGQEEVFSGRQLRFRGVRMLVCVIRTPSDNPERSERASTRATPAPKWGYVRAVNIGSE